jgi:hypothetical protein
LEFQECSVESQAVKRRLGGWYEMATSQSVSEEKAVGREPPFKEDFSMEQTSSHC